jgi:RNA methyltransferase, TrmH family
MMTTPPHLPAATHSTSMNSAGFALSIQEVAALKRRKEREETGWILVEGRHPLEEALRGGLVLQAAFVRENAPVSGMPQTELPFPAKVVDEKTMGRMADTHSAPPCLAVFERPAVPMYLTGSLALVLDEIQDPGNLGALLRSAVAFGVDSVLILGDAVEAYSPKVIRASAGLIFALPVIFTSRATLNDVMQPQNGEAAWQLFSTTVADKGNDADSPAENETASTVSESPVLSYRAVDYTGRCAIVLGNEGRGIAPELLNAPGMQRLTIPMSPRVESLNVAISGAIILAEAAAQRVQNRV